MAYNIFCILIRSSSAIISKLPMSIRGNMLQRDELLAAGEHGRLGLDCSKLYPDCPGEEMRFVTMARERPIHSDVQDRQDRFQKLAEWTFFRERFFSPMFLAGLEIS